MDKARAIEIQEKVAEIAGDQYKVCLNEKIILNGGVEYQICVGRADSNIRPSVTIQGFVDEFGDDIEKIAQEIFRVISAHIDDPIVKMESVNRATTKEGVLEDCFIQLVSKTGNEAMEQLGIVTFDYLDLKAVIRVRVWLENGDAGSYLLRREQMEILDIPEDVLIETAKKNTALGLYVKSMYEWGYRGETEPVLIGSNAEKRYGAAILLYAEKFRETARRFGGDLWIIPSSIHEVIVMPKEGEEAFFIRRIIHEVNRGFVDNDMRLSDSLYEYSYETGEIKVA